MSGGIDSRNSGCNIFARERGVGSKSVEKTVETKDTADEIFDKVIAMCLN